MRRKNSRYIVQEILVGFDLEPLVIKSPICPSYFEWKDKKYVITRVLLEWKDFSRRGKVARNIRSAHIVRASVYGSKGVGKFYFRILTQSDQIFDIYYDRASKDSVDYLGRWIIFREILK